MRGAIPPLPQHVFVAWCLVQHRDNFTFNFMYEKLFHAITTTNMARVRALFLYFYITNVTSSESVMVETMKRNGSMNFAIINL